MRLRAAVFAMAFVMTALMSAELLTAWAANARIAFSDPSATVGSQVSVNMKITSSENLQSADITLAYDSNILEFVSGTSAEGGSGAVRVRGDGGTPGTKTLSYTLKFNARTAGTSKITVTREEVTDANLQVVTVNQLGSSTVTVGALQTASKEASLQSLQVSPGALIPPFSPDVDTYAVTVGTDVEKLIVTAQCTDENANYVFSGHEDLQMGENRVTCKVTAQDGETTKEYVIVVTKAEGGASAGSADADLATGVKMKISKREITVLEPDESVQIPEGFKESIINIDENNKVRGWVWGADTDHQYCVVYGMNEAGEKNFYRYDMKDTERTLQRYFEDPAVKTMVSKADYDELAATYDKLCDDYKLFQIFLIAAILIAVALLILVLVVVLKKKDNSPGRMGGASGGPARGKRGAGSQSLNRSEDVTGDGDEYPGGGYEGEYEDESPGGGYGGEYEDEYPRGSYQDEYEDESSGGGYEDEYRDEYPKGGYEDEYGDGYPKGGYEDEYEDNSPRGSYEGQYRDGGYRDEYEDGRHEAPREYERPSGRHPEERSLRTGSHAGAQRREPEYREKELSRPVREPYGDEIRRIAPESAGRPARPLPSGRTNEPEALRKRTEPESVRRRTGPEPEDEGEDFEIFDL